jgi:DNA repair protein RadC
MMSVMIVSGVTPTDPHCDDLASRADTNAQVIQRRTSTLGKLHNHPSGDPKPSAADVAITREIIAAMNAISVKVHDHLVIGRNGAESFKSLGLL